MASHALFVYGTLMSPEVVAKVLKSQTSLHSVTQNVKLHNFQRYRVHGEYYPAAIPHQDCSIDGALIENITDTEIAFMDEFEGGEYRREHVSVIIEGCERKHCDVYVWCAGLEKLMDEDWVLDEAQIRRFLATF